MSVQNGIIQGYKILYKKHDQNETYTEIVRPASNGSYEHMNLEGLDMFTQYELKLQAYNAQGDGPFSDVVLEYTKEGGMCLYITPHL